MRLARVQLWQKGKRLVDVGLQFFALAEDVGRDAVEIDEHGEFVQEEDGVGVWGGGGRWEGEGADAVVENLDAGVVVEYFGWGHAGEVEVGGDGGAEFGHEGYG